MKSVKLFELVVLAFFASMVMFLTGARADDDIRPAFERTMQPRAMATAEMPPVMPDPMPSINGPLPMPFKSTVVKYADVPSEGDHLQVAIDLGVEYPNTCRRAFDPGVVTKGSLIEIHPRTAQDTRGMCNPVMLLKVEKVRLENLKQGQQYTVQVYSADGNVFRKAMFIR